MFGPRILPISSVLAIAVLAMMSAALGADDGAAERPNAANIGTAITTPGADLQLGQPSASNAAVVPSRIGFQGYLTDDGNPVNGPVTLDLSLHDQPAAGATLWSETQTNVPVSDGVFSIALGDMVPLPIGIFGPTPLWLEVRVDGGAPLPRTALLSAPFALRAGIADVADVAIADDGDWSISGDNVFRIPGNVGIGNGSPAEKLHVSNGDVRIDLGNDSAIESTVGNGSEGKFWSFRNTTTGSGAAAVGTSDADGAGFIHLYTRDGPIALELDGDGDDMSNDVATGLIEVRSLGTGGPGGQISVENNDGAARIDMLGGGSGDGGTFEMFNSVGDRTILLDGEAATGADIQMFNDAGVLTVDIDSENSSAGRVEVTNGVTSGVKVRLDGDGANDDGGELEVLATDGSTTIHIDGQETDNAGAIEVRNSVSSTRVFVDGEDFGGGRIDVRQSNSTNGIVLRAEEFEGADNGSVFEMFAEDGAEVVEIDSGFALNSGVNFRIEGDITATGTKNALVKVAGERRRMYCTESPEVWFDDVGSGQLVGGVAEIALDPMFLETVTINDQYPMRVMVTLTGDCNGVYVDKGIDRFTVRELMGGASNATFDYKVIAKRAGYEDARLELFETSGEDGPARLSDRSMHQPTEGLGDTTDGQSADADQTRERPTERQEPAEATAGEGAELSSR